VLGSLISFNITGIEFAMTALFTVIFVEQWLSAEHHLPAITGLICAVLSLVFIGPDNFLLPALVATVTCLLLGKSFIEDHSCV
jgi:4-azaleucine resistance transporter AzlC